MLHAIRLVASDSAIHAAPGERLDLWLTATAPAKGGGKPRSYRVDVVGLQGGWYGVAPRDVELGAGDERRIGLSIHPPLAAAPLSGRYPFRVRLVAEDGQVAASVAIELVVGARQALALRIEPEEAAGRAATFTVTLSNAMSWPATVVLHVQANAGGLRMRVAPSGPLMVPAGGQCRAAITVTPLSRAARAARPYTIEVRGALPGREGDVHEDLTGRVQFTPRRRLALPSLAFPRRHRDASGRTDQERPVTTGRRLPLWVAAVALLALLVVAVGVRQVGGALVVGQTPTAPTAPARSTRVSTPVAPTRAATVVRSSPRSAPVATRRTRVARPVGQSVPRPTATVPPSRTPTAAPSRTPTALPTVGHSPLLVARNQVSFGSHRVHATGASQTINLVNVGQSPLDVADMAVMGADTRDFSLGGTCGHARLAPYGGCSVRISFHATARGPRQASISIRGRAGQQLGVIAVSGRGF